MNEEMMMQEGEQQIDPQQQKEVEAFVGSVSKLLHGKETKGHIYEMLKGAPAEQSVPEATFQVVFRVAEKLKSKGQNPSIESLFNGTVFTASELIEIGNAGQFFEEEIGEENIQPVLQATLQRSIEEGVRRGMVDPVELQQKVEPLLSDQQRAMGLDSAEVHGISAEPGQEQAMEQYANQRVAKERQAVAAQQSAQNRKGMMQQMQGGQG